MKPSATSSHPAESGKRPAPEIPVLPEASPAPASSLQGFQAAPGLIADSHNFFGVFSSKGTVGKIRLSPGLKALKIGLFTFCVLNGKAKLSASGNVNQAGAASGTVVFRKRGVDSGKMFFAANAKLNDAGGNVAYLTNDGWTSQRTQLRNGNSAAILGGHYYQSDGGVGWVSVPVPLAYRTGNVNDSVDAPGNVGGFVLPISKLNKDFPALFIFPDSTLGGTTLPLNFFEIETDADELEFLADDLQGDAVLGMMNCAVLSCLNGGNAYDAANNFN